VGEKRQSKGITGIFGKKETPREPEKRGNGETVLRNDPEYFKGVRHARRGKAGILEVDGVQLAKP
jgi:hypothetical protein